MSRITVAALARAASAAALGLALLSAAEAPAMAASGSPASRTQAAARSAGLAARPPQPQPITPFSASTAGCQNEGSEPELQANEQQVTKTPWAQNALDFKNAWSFARGAQVLVAVVDSGVNWNPQLNGREEGIDLTNGTGLQDCVGHGTAVAGIIAAKDLSDARGNLFAGVAPDARILSVKVTNTPTFPRSASGTLAQGIIDAAELGANVISVSVQSPNTQQLQNAVLRAQNMGAVVVAAAGNDDQENAGEILTGPFYPASYPGVLSVGGLNPDGSLNGLSDQHSDIQVTAPGAGITSFADPAFYSSQWSGTSFATPFVSGVAALVLSRYHGITGQQVVQRIEATADGNTGPGTGAGMVNPLQAVTAVLPPAGQQDTGSQPSRSVQVARALPPDYRTRNASMLVTVGSVGGAALLVAAALVIIQGRRRRWRPSRAAGPGTAAGASAGPGPEPTAVPADPSEVLGGG